MDGAVVLSDLTVHCLLQPGRTNQSSETTCIDVMNNDCTRSSEVLRPTGIGPILCQFQVDVNTSIGYRIDDGV
eukprot:3167070-Pleurochrysis_carterae.AAC.1